MRPVACLAAALLTALIVADKAVARPPEPAAVRAVRNGLGAMCREAGGTPTFGATFLRTANITPDGRPDYILSAAAAGCDVDPSLHCGSGGCGVIVIASVARAYRQILDVTTRQVTLRRGGDRDILLVTLHDASCPPSTPACVEALVWNGARLTPVSLTRQGRRRAGWPRTDRGAVR